MKKRDFCDNSADNGFTLVEIILSIVMIGILGAMSAQFMASALVDSSLPIDRVQAEAGRVAVMEKIISDYVTAVNGNSPADALATINTNVSAGNYNTGNTTVTTAWINFADAGSSIFLETVVTPGPSDNLKVSIGTGNAAIVAILSATRTDVTDPKVNF